MCFAFKFVLAAGVDYEARQYENQALEDDLCAGDIQDKEYNRRRWPQAEM